MCAQIADGTGLECGKNGLGKPVPVRAQGQVIHQAVMKRGVHAFDGSGGVDGVDSQHERQDHAEQGEGEGSRGASDKDHSPHQYRQAKGVVENHFNEERSDKAHQQDEHRCHDVGHLDSRAGASKLVIDELLVIQQLAIRLCLRAQAHDRLLPADVGSRCSTGPYYTPIPLKKNER